MKFTLEDILTGAKGKALNTLEKNFKAVSTDSRTIEKGDLFIALKGENFDGHNYIEEIIKKGAAGVLVSNNSKTQVTTIQVPDTLKALQTLGTYWRKKNKAKIIAITGSNGKTTTKFFTKNILEKKFKVFASEKSFNNHFGVPLTLLNIDRDTEFCICEVGTNHPGEIKLLTEICEPDIAVVTTVGDAHIGMFGSKEIIAKEKADIYNHPSNPLRVYNLDNTWTQEMYLKFKTPTRGLTFSAHSPNADVLFKIKSESLHDMNIEGFLKGIPGQARVEFFGTHNLYNLMAAAGLGLWAGMEPAEIWERLPYCRTTWGRNQILKLKSGAQVVFDGYNANPDSMRAMIESAANIKTEGKKIVVLGDMLELGDHTIVRHEELGKLVGRMQFDIVCFMGENARAFEQGLKGSGFNKKSIISNRYEENLATDIRSMLQPGDIIFVKGSRGARMERILPQLDPLNWENK